MRPILAAFACILLAGTALADQALPGKLVGQAIVPAESFFNPPADAPADLAVSGKFTNADKKAHRHGRLGDGRLLHLRARRAARDRREAAVQGPADAGLLRPEVDGDGEFWVLQDNGFGTKANSPDAMLVLHRIKPDWASGKVEVLRTIFVHDADKKMPFQITLEGTPKRYLTGADLDVESFQTIGDKIWIGDEFGPYLIRIDRTARSRPCSRP